MWGCEKLNKPHVVKSSTSRGRESSQEDADKCKGKGGRHLIGICSLTKDMSMGNLNNLRKLQIELIPDQVMSEQS